MKITRAIAEKLNDLLDHGLSSGLGVPRPGQMCVQAAVSKVMGLKHGDQPMCVHPIVIKIGIRLNDCFYGTPQERAEMLRRFAIAELGSKELNQGELNRSIIRNLAREFKRYASNINSYSDANDAVTYIVNALPSEEGIMKRIADTVTMSLAECGSPGAKFLDVTCPVLTKEKV